MSWLTGIAGTSFLSDLGNPGIIFSGQLSPSQNADIIASGQGQIQSVADNAKQLYDASVAATTQAYATQQEAKVPGDVASINASLTCQNPKVLGVCIDGLYTYKWYFIGAGLLIVLGILSPYVKLFEDHQ